MPDVLSYWEMNFVFTWENNWYGILNAVLRNVMGARDFKLVIIQNQQQDYCQQNAPLKICYSKLSVLTFILTGSFLCKTKEGKETKVYILLLICSRTRAITSWNPTSSVYTGVYNGFKTINCVERKGICYLFRQRKSFCCILKVDW